MRDNAYSQFVSYAKVILPLISLALLSTLFLFARPSGNGSDIPYADIESIAREPRLNGPDISGVTETGGAFSIAADVARPIDTQDGSFAIEGINIKLESPTGQAVQLTAGQGTLLESLNRVIFDNLVRLASNDGYLMEMRGLIADLDQGHLESTAPLEIRAPFGSLTAGHMEVIQTGSTVQMNFNQGVTLIYQPPN